MKTSFKVSLSTLGSKFETGDPIILKDWEVEIDELRSAITKKIGEFRNIVDALKEEEAQCNTLMSKVCEKFMKQQIGS